MSSDHFTSSSGKKIRLIPDWFEQKKNWPSGHGSLVSYVDAAQARKTGLSGFPLFVNKLLYAGYVRALLEQRLVKLPIGGPMLDIRTGPAILPRAFKALGLCTEAYGIDPKDGRSICPDAEMVRFWLDARNIVASKIETDLLSVIGEVDFNNVGSILYDEFDTSQVRMDDYIAGDFVRDPPGKEFALITMMGGLPEYNINEFLEALSRALTPSGVFITSNSYYYEIWGGKHLPMDAPWLHARLSLEELVEYYDARHPELAGSVKKLLVRKSTHLTPDDYGEEAAKHNLDFLGYERKINRENLKTLIFCDETFSKYINAEVLPECMALNPRCTLDDLFTEVLTMIFRKKF